MQYFISPYLLIPKRFFPLFPFFYLNFRYPSSSFSAEYFTGRGYENKSLKRTIVNFHVLIRKSLLQICAEQLISGVEFQISQNNRYEIYTDMNFISFLNMQTFR